MGGESKAIVVSDRWAVRLLICFREPLCRFLGKPTPNEPFPNGNTPKEYESRMGNLYLKGRAEAERNLRVVIGVLLGAAVAGASCFFVL